VKIPRVLAALATAAMVALPVAVVHATSDAAIVQATSAPAIQSIVAQGCADDKVCVTLTVENPVAGNITLELTGHTPASKVFVDTGARLPFTIVPGTTTYTDCFLNVSSFVEPDFNTLRVEFASSDIAGLNGTDAKSNSFEACSSTATPTPTPPGSPPPSQTPTPPQSPTPTPPHSPTPTPTTSQPAGSTPTPTATPAGGGGLAQTGGFQFGFVLAGLVLLVAGLSVLGVTRARSRSSQP
jgi:cell division septation protein DedD